MQLLLAAGSNLSLGCLRQSKYFLLLFGTPYSFWGVQALQGASTLLAAGAEKAGHGLMLTSLAFTGMQLLLPAHGGLPCMRICLVPATGHVEVNTTANDRWVIWVQLRCSCLSSQNALMQNDRVPCIAVNYC